MIFLQSVRVQNSAGAIRDVQIEDDVFNSIFDEPIVNLISQTQETKAPAKPERLNSQQAAEYLGVSKSTLDKYCSERRIAYSKPTGKIRYFLQSDLDEFIESGGIQTQKELNAKAFGNVLKRGRG